MEHFYINYKGMLIALLRMSWLMLLAFILVFFGVYYTRETSKTPVYSATATMYVSNNSEGITSGSYSTNTAYSAKALISVCSVVIKSNKAMNSIMTRLDEVDGVADGVYTGADGSVYTAASIKASIRVASVSDTEVMSISLSTRSREDSAAIVNAIISVVPEIIINIIHVGYAEVLDTAYFSGTANLPSTQTPMTYGFIAVVIIALGTVLVTLLDTRIHSKEELTSIYKLPVLGEIPNFATKQTERYHYYGHKHTEKAE